MPSPSDQHILKILGANQWLASLPPSTLAELASSGRTRRYADNDEIAGRNKQPEGLALVLSGAIRSSNLSEDGREIAFSLVLPGSLWGLVACLDGAGAVHDTRASGKTELFVIPSQALRTVMARRPELCAMAVQMLCYRLRKAYSAVDELALATLRQRLARQLCTLVAGPGPAQAPGEERRIAVTQDELAVLVGATRPSINRELATMERQGLIRREYGRVTVLDYKNLHELCVTRRIFDL